MVWTRKRQAAVGKLHGTGTQTVKMNPGKAKLIAELDKQIGEKSSEMAKKLVDDFLAGKVTSMKMLNAMADELINCEDLVVISQLCSYAESLAGEQQVAAETAEAAVETVNVEVEAELAIQ
ncbi:MAG: hypothetical protein ACLPXT_12405 [Terracidiphilus sp.]